MNGRRFVGVAVLGAFASGGLMGFWLGPDRSGEDEAGVRLAAPGSALPADDPVEAALAAVAAQPRLYRSGGVPAVEQDLRSRASAEAQDRLVAQFHSGMEHVTQAWPEGRTAWWLAPLATRSTPMGSDRATVEIWFAEVIVPPRFAPYADWRTTTLEMRQVAGEWKVTDSRDGPAPFLRTNPDAVPTERPGLVGFLEGFEGIDRG
jgi:hypothetical protein